MESTNVSRPLSRLFQAGLLCALAYFSWLMLEITLQYIPIQEGVAFLQIKQQYLWITEWKVAFFIHVFTSMFALVAGFTQFARWILRKHPSVHRWMGRLYVVTIVFITGPSGFIMGLYANGGFPSRLAFCLLSIAWIGTTILAYRAIMLRKFEAHRRWMIRSYALTLSAITLRIWKLLIVAMFAPRPMDVYQVVAWLGWIPNLLVAEWIIRATTRSVVSAPPKAEELSRSDARQKTESSYPLVGHLPSVECEAD